MNSDDSNGLGGYNGFCKNLKEGYILYNLDSTNLWGDYLLVANITSVKIGSYKTYTILLIGLKKDGDNFVPRNMSIKMTPDYASNIPFLKYVGKCKFQLFPIIEEADINIGLAAVYGNTDLHKFATKLSIRKPKTRKYGKDGKLIIKK